MSAGGNGYIDIFGYSKSGEDLTDLQTQELKNGRLAMIGLSLSQCLTQLSVISRASRLPGVTMQAPDSSKGKKSGKSTVARMAWSIPWASEGREPAERLICQLMRQITAAQRYS